MAEARVGRVWTGELGRAGTELLDVRFEGAGGGWTVPAFVDSSGAAKVRFAPPVAGTYQVSCAALDWSTTIEAVPAVPRHHLDCHGGLGVSDDSRYLAHADGTPFCWLGDTWWYGLSGRLTDAEFAGLADQRVRQGFNVIQMVAGLNPDVGPFDPRCNNDGGFAWTADWDALNPAWFDAADRRVAMLVEAGLVPCIVGCWGYYLPWLGVAKMQRHWREIIARWAAYPVVWCLAGEGTMPWYLSETKDADREELRSGWSTLAAYVRETDPFGRLITIHPSRSGRECVNQASSLDFDMLQTGHGSTNSYANTLRVLAEKVSEQPTMPVVESEVNYEGIGEACRQEVQRWCFWATFLSGGKGFTYGANGLWQFNGRDDPFGASPSGMDWGQVPWEDAAKLPGAAHVAMGKQLLERWDWWRFEPHPEWLLEHASPEEPGKPICGGIPGDVRVIYWTVAAMRWAGGAVTVQRLEPGIKYNCRLFNPENGAVTEIGEVVGDADGRWVYPGRLPIYRDWVIALEA